MTKPNLDRLWTWIDNSEIDFNLKEILFSIHAELENLSEKTEEEK